MTDKEDVTDRTAVEYKTTTGTHGVLFASSKRLASVMGLAKSMARGPIMAVAVTDFPVNGKLTYTLNK